MNAKNVLLTIQADDDEEICNKAMLKVLAVREAKSKKSSVTKVKKIPQHHLIVLFVNFSFHQLILMLHAATK